MVLLINEKTKKFKTKYISISNKYSYKKIIHHIIHEIKLFLLQKEDENNKYNLTIEKRKK